MSLIILAVQCRYINATVCNCTPSTKLEVFYCIEPVFRHDLAAALGGLCMLLQAQSVLVQSVSRLTTQSALTCAAATSSMLRGL
jgi:hypothetical protein